VAAALLARAIGSQLTCVFVDHGLMRKNEGDEVEQAFAQALTARLDAAAERGVEQKRLRAQVERYGALSCAWALLGRGRVSDGFDALAAAGRLDLTLEALAVEGRFAELFTDAEVNQALSALLEAGYTDWK